MTMWETNKPEGLEQNYSHVVYGPEIVRYSKSRTTLFKLRYPNICVEYTATNWWLQEMSLVLYLMTINNERLELRT